MVRFFLYLKLASIRELKIMNIMIRDEQIDDIQAIEELTKDAFKDIEYSSHTEHFIINALRKKYQLTLSLVALENNTIVGHIAVSPVSMSSGIAGWFGLGPISVLPDQKGLGIGSRLVYAALDRLKALNANGCVLLGDPKYYARFGFQPIANLVLENVPAEYFQAISFDGYFPKAQVFYDEVFNATK